MPWKKGQSGNPAGRRPSDAEMARAALRKDMEAKTPAIVNRLYEQALAGDVQAMRTWLERVLPALKPVASAVVLPAVAEAPTATQQALLIVRAMANGQIAPDVMHEILTGIGQAARITEIDELARRVSEIEKRTPP